MKLKKRNNENQHTMDRQESLTKRNFKTIRDKGDKKYDNFILENISDD